MKNIVLIGASGYVGSAILNELIHRQYNVTAIARNTSTISNSALVKKVALDITDQKELVKMITGADVVISAFNAGWSNPNLYEDFTTGIQTIHNAVKEAKVERLIVIGGAGTLYIKPGLQLVDTADFPDFIKPGATAVRDYFEQVLSKENGFIWTYFSPAIEMNPQNPGKRTGHFRLSNNTPVYDSECRSRISVEDVAVAIVDEVENEQFKNTQFTIGY
ncbi:MULTISPECIES: NAD(P)-dependent oxidoreductase [Myroides]|uniref:NAD(P)-dependent oxidoreductase n=1 Tax=Myroides TaxID=76831 RepID=UPI00057D9DD6|nr:MULTISPECIES: NAD(P)H-binding protein [Myroides]AJA67651.1 Putative NADH-flavin reductase [Myroides sp. A21]MDM1519825.1 NAD(P)H-binding protein [Myroides odoratimimus]